MGVKEIESRRVFRLLICPISGHWCICWSRQHWKRLTIFFFESRKEKEHTRNLAYGILSLICLQNVQVETVSKQLYMLRTKRRLIFCRKISKALKEGESVSAGFLNRSSAESYGLWNITRAIMCKNDWKNIKHQLWSFMCYMKKWSVTEDSH